MLEAINTAATVATLFVLTAGAIAAAIQLRHMQKANQLQAFIDIYSRAQSPEMQQLFDIVFHEVPKLAQDPDYIERVARGDVRLAGNPLVLAFWFDEVGIVLRERLVSERVIFQIGGSAHNTVRSWLALRPLVEAVRKRAPAAFLHFEYAAVAARQWIERHPSGDYPRGAPRWHELDGT
jgi:hypothetical protein